MVLKKSHNECKAEQAVNNQAGGSFLTTGTSDCNTVLKVDIWELETRNLGAQLQVSIVSTYGVETMVWEYQLDQDESGYVGESHDVSVGDDLHLVKIKVNIPD